MRKLNFAAAVATAAFFAVGAASTMQGEGPRPKMTEAPSADARWQAWAQQRPGRPVQAMVQFDGVTADARVRAILSRAGAAPYSVLMYLDGRYGAHTTDPSRASLDLIETARRKSVEMREAQALGLKQRARAMLEGGFEDRREIAAALPAIEAQRSSSLAGLRRGVPIIYAAKVVGPAEALKALEREPGVASVAPGLIAGDRVAVPNPQPPAAAQPPSAARRSDAEVKEGLRAIAGPSSGE